MAAKFVVFFAACVVLSQAGPVRRDAPNVLEDVGKHVAEFKQTFEEQLTALKNSPSTQNLNKALTDGSNSLLQQFAAFTNTLQGAMTEATGKTREALEQTSANLQRAAADFQRRHPQVNQQAEQLGDHLKNFVRTGFEETQKLLAEVSANAQQTGEKLTPAIRGAYDDLLKHAQTVKQQLDAAAAAAAATPAPAPAH